MANLDDLDKESISNMNQDEAIELLRQIRLNRRMPAKAKKSSPKKAKQGKPPELTPAQAAAMLELIGGNK